MRRFLALGDSYTMGESVPPADAWPRQLADRLGGADRPVETTIVATTGWTSRDLLDALDGAALDGRFDLVSLQIGVNDQYRGLPIDAFRANVRALLARAATLSAGGTGRTLVVSIPDWGVTPFASDRDRSRVAGEVDRFNAAYRLLASAAGVPFVDVTTTSRRHPGDVAGDGLHPSGAQYRQWVDAIAPVACALLGAGTG